MNNEDILSQVRRFLERADKIKLIFDHEPGERLRLDIRLGEGPEQRQLHTPEEAWRREQLAESRRQNEKLESWTKEIITK